MGLCRNVFEASEIGAALELPHRLFFSISMVHSASGCRSRAGFLVERFKSELGSLVERRDTRLPS